MRRGLAELEGVDPVAWSQPSTHAPAPHLAAPPAPRRGRRSGEPRAKRQVGPVLPSLLITGLVLGGALAWAPGNDFRTLRALIGIESGDSSDYAFMQTQPVTGGPVGYSPCQPIEVEINPEGAPSNYRELVDTAIEHVSEPSGLEFRVVGETTRRYADAFSSGEATPVLVSWADSDEVPALAGNVAGLGGSSSRDRGGVLRYVTGAVTLDADAYADLAGRQDDAQAIIDHEFGHLVGLDHVTAGGELMAERNTGITSWGEGDLRGLELLGDLPC